MGALRRVFAAVDAGFEGTVMWRGPGLDRLLDADHAHLCGIATERLRRDGWDPLVEASYSVNGERGSIDVLAAKTICRCVLVEEVKTSLVSVEATLRKLDEKTRLVRERLCLDRFGWVPRAVGRLLVFPDSTSGAPGGGASRSSAADRAAKPWGRCPPVAPRTRWRSRRDRVPAGPLPIAAQRCPATYPPAIRARYH